MVQKILIVGAGPTGLAAALTLARRGVTPRIIDAKEEPIATSNALAVHARTLEVFEALGVIDDALAAGHRIGSMQIASPSGLLGTLSLEALPTKYPFVLALPQAETERILTQHLEKYGIAIERGTTFEALIQKADGIEVRAGAASAKYDWVVGCDGPSSAVREQAGIAFPGYDLPQHFVMADLTVEWDRSDDSGHVFLTDEGPVAFFPLNNEGLGRIIFDVSRHPRLKEEKHPTLGDFQALMRERCPISAQLRDAVWTSGFWIHSRHADAYREGRIFIAGDAAHQHSPVGGQGMNTGIQDAYFLGEQLAAVIEGRANAKSLDSYEAVRRPIGRAIVRGTTFFTRVVSTRSKMWQAVRNAILKLALRLPFLRRTAAMWISELHYGITNTQKKG